LAKGVWSSLKALDISGCSITIDGIKLRGHIVYLFFPQPTLIDLDLLTFMGRICGNIRQLHLCSCHIGNKGVAKLKESGLKLIDTLDISHNSINGYGIKMLASSDFSRLNVLNINANKICNRGMSYLAKGNWPKL
jgi:hypothetical protein